MDSSNKLSTVEEVILKFNEESYDARSSGGSKAAGSERGRERQRGDKN
eukprot:CAMPEP_0172534426 /NCGR_PEP_ID=MMETSP1067-20121228/6799_1 /TAXON_ID=265564 ORGANISM="Thalassiosira punctigera, Strain Tpunct2005C2" /NCGR_SAMPLE_ID=MMETSP1067 /ASSEMBLY_ACC=CAM_ASM_000444 /LENGTH=47 /DNA_ID= /DNA_START= /DNA_END= /DNA_ORIENTATION=